MRALSRFILLAGLSFFTTKMASAVQMENKRSVFLQSEDVEIDVSGLPANGSVAWKVAGDLAGQAKVDGEGRAVITWKKNTLRAGSYTLEWGGSADAAEKFPFRIAFPMSSERLRHLLWPDNPVGFIFGSPDTSLVRQAVETYKGLGFTDIPVYPPKSPGDDADTLFMRHEIGVDQSREIPPTTLPIVRKNIEEILAAGLTSGLHGPGPYSPKEEKLRIQTGEGKYNAYYPNPWLPANIEEEIRRTKEVLEAFSDLPQMDTYFVSTEIEWPMDLSPEGRKRIQEELGFQPEEVGEPLFAEKGVLSNADKALAYKLYFYRRGQGDRDRNARIAGLVKQQFPDTLTWSDPFRLLSVKDFFRGLDMVSTWTYTTPDPKYILSTESLIAVARPYGQKVMPTVTLLNYPGTLEPGDTSVQTNWDGYIAPSGDRYAIVQWLNLSRRVDYLCTYFSMQLNVMNPDAKEKTHIYNPDLWKAMAEFDKEVVRPLGPVIKKLERVSRRVALYDGTAARVRGKVPRGPGYYPGYEILDFAAVLAMAQISFDVVFEEEVEEGILEKYQVVAVPKADVITERARDALRKFIERGGTVVVDPHFQAEIGGVIRVPWTQLYRTTVNANALVEGKQKHNRDDRMRSDGLIEVDGVTAEEDAKRMASFAEDLKSRLRGKFDRDVDADSPYLLTNRLRHGEVDYVFAVNDRRGYDERVGKFRAMLEEGLPLKTKLRIRTSLETAAVVELRTGVSTKVTAKDGWITLPVELPGASGAVYAVLPHAIADLGVKLMQREADRPALDLLINIRTENKKPSMGVLPVELIVKRPDGSLWEGSGFFGVEDGSRLIPIPLARNEAKGEWNWEVRLFGESALGRSGTFKVN